MNAWLLTGEQRRVLAGTTEKGAGVRRIHPHPPLEYHLPPKNFTQKTCGEKIPPKKPKEKKNSLPIKTQREKKCNPESGLGLHI